MGDRPNQIDRQRDDVVASREELLSVPQGHRSDEALRTNIRVGIRYLESWLGGVGCVPLYNLMEDAATAEISRTQIWQWLRHGVATDEGLPVSRERIMKTIDEEMQNIAKEVGAKRFAEGHFEKARVIFAEVATNTDHFTDFLTLPAYKQLCSTSKLQEMNR